VDITLLRAATTVASFAAFLAIVVWAYSGRNRARFEKDAQLVFADERSGTDTEPRQ
jgi:cytochrome c oxidase cbb3-type subunit IV